MGLCQPEVVHDDGLPVEIHGSRCPRFQILGLPWPSVGILSVKVNMTCLSAIGYYAFTALDFYPDCGDRCFHPQ